MELITFTLIVIMSLLKKTILRRFLFMEKKKSFLSVKEMVEIALLVAIQSIISKIPPAKPQIPRKWVSTSVIIRKNLIA